MNARDPPNYSTNDCKKRKDICKGVLLRIHEKAMLLLSVNHRNHFINISVIATSFTDRGGDHGQSYILLCQGIKQGTEP